MTLEEDVENDLVLARFDGYVLNAPEDVERWSSEISERLARFGRKVDLLINLDGLRVSFAAGRAFGHARKKVLDEYSRHSFRFGGDDMTRLFVNTSSMITGAAGNAFSTREEALAALRKVRNASGA